MIRRATLEDIPNLEPLAREFYEQSRFLGVFMQDLFSQLWTGLLESGTGVIYLLMDDAGEITGTLGGVVYPEPYSGALVATEFFWFVQAGARGGGLRLLRSFEEWARARGCAQLRMGHLVDVMPEKLDRVYRRLGFVPIEVAYAKELP